MLTNHVLVNYYQKDLGIFAHKDGPLYSPQTFVLSLNSSCVLGFYEDIQSYHDDRPVQEFFIDKNSLYSFKGNLYTDLLHGIRNVELDNLENPC